MVCVLEKSYGVIKSDYAGRIIIPAKLRTAMGMDQGGVHFEVKSDGEQIILTKREKYCVLCEATEVEFKQHNGKHVCINCYNALGMKT